ncbi:histone deacetylase [Candidatus Zixiibacteriota bacterium]
MATGWLYDEAFLNHDTGPGHPESAQRLRAINAHLEKTGLAACLTPLAARPVEKDEVIRVHFPSHWDRIQKVCQEGGGFLDGDTPVSTGSWEAAVLAAGGTIAAVDAVMDGKVANAFACVRPPGHHAEPEMAMGFCLFNNVAIAARHLIAKRGLQRVLIVDWDAHHGNGTQYSFYDDPQVYYFSVHQFPFYPGEGTADETGRDKGKGYTLNVPIPGGSGDREFLMGLAGELLPAMESFRPEFILLSAGFDAHHNDPLTGLGVTDDGFIQAGLMIKRMADRHCGGKWVTVLEGGYDLHALTTGVENLLRIKLGEINGMGE